MNLFTAVHYKFCSVLNKIELDVVLCMDLLQLTALEADSAPPRFVWTLHTLLTAENSSQLAQARQRQWPGRGAAEYWVRACGTAQRFLYEVTARARALLFFSRAWNQLSWDCCCLLLLILFAQPDLSWLREFEHVWTLERTSYERRVGFASFYD